MGVVHRDNVDECLAHFRKPGQYAIDTETTGLRPYLGDALFSIIVCGPAGSFYFNFQDYGPEHSFQTLDKALVFPKLQELFDVPDTTWFAHNAKFDLAMLAKEGLHIQGRVHCTEAIARTLYNQHFNYTLDACVKRIGLEKSKDVDEYVKKHKLSTKLELEGGKVEKLLHYDRVPFEIITEYGLKDGEITYALGLDQLAELARHTSSTPAPLPSPMQVYNNELKFTKTLFAMEQVGIRIDRDFCRRGYDYETGRAATAAAEFAMISGQQFIDSAGPLSKAFDAAGESYPRTVPTPSRPNGTPSFTDEVLEGFSTPLAKLLQEYRRASKTASTYYANFLRYADENDRIHANIRQGGTATGRLSYGEPNLQNLTKDEDTSKEFLVRRALIPDPDHCFVMIDYEQMEYRLMLDYAGEMEVIKQVLAGLDVHTATAQRVGVERDKAKTLNFLLLYGGGAGKLAKKLNISEATARALRQEYFAKLPNVKRWTQLVMERAANQQRQIVNWLGRRYYFDIDHTYVGPNHLIQGGCGDVLRVDMNRIHEYLKGKRSRMLVQIHDELLFGIHKDEFEIISELKHIMETTYPYKNLPLTCDVSHSWKSWADKVKGMPK